MTLGARPPMMSTKSRRMSIVYVEHGDVTYEVVSQQLHDECGVFVALLAQGVELGNGIIESLLGQVASLIRGVEDLIVEDREVQGKTEADWVRGGEIGLSDFGSILVGLKGHVCRALSLLGDGELGKISVVVTLPVECISIVVLRVKSMCLTSCGRRPWTRQSEQRQSSACQEPRECLRRSCPTRLRLLVDNL